MSAYRFLRVAAQLTALSLIVSVAAWGQGTAEITGTVADSSGAAMSGAKVTVTNTATSAKRSATTNESGIYDLPALAPGNYDMTVESAGFRSSERKGMELQVAQVARLDGKAVPGHHAVSPVRDGRSDRV